MTDVEAFNLPEWRSILESFQIDKLVKEIESNDVIRNVSEILEK